MSIRYLFYRPLMKLAHRFHWHYAPPVYPDGDTMLRCSWCGFSQVVKRRSGCHCEPGRCMAPKIMGQQMHCLDPNKARMLRPAMTRPPESA